MELSFLFPDIFFFIDALNFSRKLYILFYSQVLTIYFYILSYTCLFHTQFVASPSVI